MIDKKTLVMECTRDFVLEVGIEAISMSKIAKRSGVPVGTIYYWFENKLDLINQTYIMSRNKLIPEYREIDKSHLVSSLKDYVKLYIENSAQNSNDLLLVHSLHLSPIIMSQNIMEVDTNIGDIKLSKLMELGIIKNVQPDVIDSAVVGMIQEFIAYRIYNKKDITEQDIDEMSALAWDAIKA